MANEVYHYMVDFTMPAVLTERFTSRIPDQRALVNKYFTDGKLVSYSVSLEKLKVWAVFIAESEEEILDLIRAMPLTRYMRHEISVLTFYNILTSRVPNFSMN